jgi:tRNA (adenine22-N1)-methyltransferase
MSMPVTAPVVPYLSSRLQALYQWVAAAQAGAVRHRYDEVWDCCCDHGYLGTHILANKLCSQVHFVDQVAHLIEGLRPRLKEYPADRYQTLIADASELRFVAERRHLIIIAGVGGEHSVDIVRAIVANHPQQTLDFMFCPTTTQFDLREYLAESAFELLHESLVSDKNREYEVICARSNVQDTPKPTVSHTGRHWDLSIAAHRRYLTKLITHYQRCTLGTQAAEAQRILDAYQATWERAAVAQNRSAL